MIVYQREEKNIQGFDRNTAERDWSLERGDKHNLLRVYAYRLQKYLRQHRTIKVQLAPPQKFFPFIEILLVFLITSAKKNISIDKIPAFLIPVSYTEHNGIWVGLSVTSSKDMAQNTQGTFYWFRTLRKYIWGIYVSYFIKSGKDFK